MLAHPLGSTWSTLSKPGASIMNKRSFILLVTLSSAPVAKCFSAWSDSAVQQAQALSISERAKLLADPAVIKPRSVSIRGRSVDEASDSNQNASIGRPAYEITKVVHFQRHGQGYHNLLGDILRDAGVKPDIDSTDPAVNPWLRSEIVDSPLTEIGKAQCQGQRPRASKLNPELVVVSPLQRAIQTAEITFADFYETNVPWVAHEGCREELGMLVCNKRRPLSHIQKDFPHVQFLNMPEEDLLWNPSERESSESKSDRIYDFLVNFIAERPEKEIAVIGHSAWLFHMCNAVLDCGDDPELQSWFLTSEVRSIELTFSRE